MMHDSSFRAQATGAGAVPPFMRPVPAQVRRESADAPQTARTLPPPTLVSYATVVAACGQGRQWQQALNVLRMMDKSKKTGVVPNAVIYSAVIAACGNARQVDLAVSLLREMTPANGVPY